MSRHEKTQFEWAARSAIQKGIRRGDPSLTFTAFEILFRIEPKWLLWRLKAIVPEEIWQLSGKNVKILSKVELLLASGKHHLAYKILKKWVLELCKYSKNRDANGLSWLITVPKFRHRLFSYRLNDLHLMQWELLSKNTFPYSKLQPTEAVKFFDSLRELASGDAQRLEVIDAAEHRFLMGGMLGDRIMLMATAVLAATEPDVDPPEKSLCLFGEPDVLNEWPWYVYDFHTLVGRRALEDVRKLLYKDKNRGAIDKIWFMLESGRVNTLDFRSFWWKLALKCYLDVYKIDRSVWESEGGYRDLIKQAVIRSYNLYKAKEMAIESNSRSDIHDEASI